MNKKDKWYIPDEFKNLRNKGVTQIAIGIVIAIFGAFNPNQGIVFVVCGVIWAFVGICLVISKSIDEQDNRQNKDTKNRAKDNSNKK